MLAHWWVKPGPGISGCRVLGVLELVLSHWWTRLVPDMAGYPEACVSLLVGQTRSWGSWLRGTRCLTAGVGLLVGGAEAQWVSGLVPAHWWVRLEPAHWWMGPGLMGP